MTDLREHERLVVKAIEEIGPSKNSEIASFAGKSRQSTKSTIDGIRLKTGERLIYISGWYLTGGRMSPIYAAQTGCDYDAPKPPPPAPAESHKLPDDSSVRRAWRNNSGPSQAEIDEALRARELHTIAAAGRIDGWGAMIRQFVR